MPKLISEMGKERKGKKARSLMKVGNRKSHGFGDRKTH
jgi:hypothetical protein